ncbi:MAG: hypothetical protein WDO16_07260 [Bacteroidota bacterium]
MAIIVKAKTRKQEKVVKDFLNQLDIEFQTIAEEDEAPYKIISKSRLLQKKRKY